MCNTARVTAYCTILNLARNVFPRGNSRANKIRAWHKIAGIGVILSFFIDGMAQLMQRKVVLFCLLLTVAQRVVGQSSVGVELPCQAPSSDPDPNNPRDNLSCPNTDPSILECYSRAELCNNVQFCTGGSDEGADLVALECRKLLN